MEEYINNALKDLVKSTETSQFVNSLVELEKKYAYNTQIREHITGKIIDAMFKNTVLIRKTLENGLVFEFIHQNRITRDFILSSKPNPDHVWEPQTTRLLLNFGKNADNVIVGGAYIGDHAVLIGNEIKETGGVCHTFEPDQNSIRYLQNNVEINNLENVKINCKALWDESGKYIVLEGDDVLGSSVEVKDEKKGGILTITIDDYVKENELDKIDLIMLDLEGGEHRALIGASNTLESMNPTVVFETHSLYNDWSKGIENSEIMKLMLSFGYNLFAIRDFHSNVDTKNIPVELIPINRINTEGPDHGFNMLAVKHVDTLDKSFFSIVNDLSPKLFIDRKTIMNHPAAWI